MLINSSVPHYPKYRRVGARTLSHGIYAVAAGMERNPPRAEPFVYARPSYSIQYVAKGSGTYMGRPFSAGCGYLLTPLQTASISFDDTETSEVYWLSFRGEQAAEWLKACGLPDRNAVFSFEDTARCVDLIRACVLAEEAANGYAEDCRLQATLFQLMALHLERPAEEIPPARNPAHRIARFFEENLDQPLQLRQVADLFYLSTGYMYTLFKKEFGVSPKEYLLNLRIRQAKRLLREEKQLPVKTVAAAVGFENPLYFSRCFHRRTGVSPKAFREENQ